MRVALSSRPEDDRAPALARDLIALLERQGQEVRLEDHLARALGRGDGSTRSALADDTDLAIVLGGDGTQLAACRSFAPRGVPIWGINLGRLGFLTDVGPEQVQETLPRILTGAFTVEERMMLLGEVVRADGTIEGPFPAANDLVVNKGALAQVVRIETRVDDRFVSSYLADGIILGTPTGSTAYGLAVGGPILMPETELILVAPICPHILTNRPLIVRGESRVEAAIVETRGEVFLTIDGQEGFALHRGDTVRARRSPHRARLVRTSSRDFFGVLRSKLGWGASPTPS